MNIDDFCKEIDRIIKDGDITMVLEYHPGETEPEVRSNVAMMGPVVSMYLLMHAMKKTLNEIFAMEVMDSTKKAECLEEALKMIKAEILKEER